MANRLPAPTQLNPMRLFVLPTLIFAVAYLVVTYGGLDHLLAATIYHGLGDTWRLRNNPIFEIGFHQIGKALSFVAWFGCLYLLIRNGASGFSSSRQKALLLLVVSVVTTTTIVSLAKGATHMDCPWDLRAFGGHRIYVPLFQRDLVNTEVGRCFPAGQASAGYAWIALYFAARLHKPDLRFKALAIGIAFGMVLGIAQQLRGAHFLSHDLTTAWIAWMVPATFFAIVTRRPGVSERSSHEKFTDFIASTRLFG